jgi:hypothetical protein
MLEAGFQDSRHYSELGNRISDSERARLVRRFEDFQITKLAGVVDNCQRRPGREECRRRGDVEMVSRRTDDRVETQMDVTDWTAGWGVYFVAQDALRVISVRSRA